MKGRACTALVWHMEDALSHRTRIFIRLVELRGTGLVYSALNQGLATAATKISPPHLERGCLCLTQGKSAVGAYRWLRLECWRAWWGHSNTDAEWDLVQPTWFDVDETAIGLAHPQSPISWSIPILEIISARKASAFYLKIPNDRGPFP